MTCPVQGHAGYLDQGHAAQNFSREIAQAGQRSLSLTTARTKFSLGITTHPITVDTVLSAGVVIDLLGGKSPLPLKCRVLEKCLNAFQWIVIE